MLGRRITLIFAILSLLVIATNGVEPPVHLPIDTLRCPMGTPVTRHCTPRMILSTCPKGSYCYSPNDSHGLCCPTSTKFTCSSGGSHAGPCSTFGANQCPIGHICSSASVDGSGICCQHDIQILPLKCQNGGVPNGGCVPSVTNQCGIGFFCQDVKGDTTGVCCPTLNAQPSLGS